MDYKLDLISNFTYAIDQVHGDQFEQFDQRHVFGGNVAYVQPLSLLDLPGTFKSGAQIRYDDISPVALYHTQERVRCATVREDQVKQTSYSAYVSQELGWTPWFRSELGLRADYFRFDVQSNLAANSGRSNDSIVSPKASAGIRTLGQNGVFPRRRQRLSQQRCARHHRHGGPE
jgi:outer membrane receptor protein involved in Fe transport